MTTLRDGSDESGCAHHWTEAGLRAETREQVAREIEEYFAELNKQVERSSESQITVRFTTIEKYLRIAAKIARGK